MTVKSHRLKLRTTGEDQIIDITDEVQKILSQDVLTNGVAFLFVPGSTGALTTIEYEPGLLVDFPKMLDRLVPKSLQYEHERRWHDGNGHSHVRASLLGPDLFVPFEEGRLVLGTWQQIVFVELDARPRDRSVVIELMGE